MRGRQVALGIVKRLPYVGDYLRAKNQTRTELENHVIGLEQAVDRLEKRNVEWAAEVDELRGSGKSLTILWPVFESDIIAADYRKPPHIVPVAPHAPPYTFNWVVPPVGSISGGHAVIMYLISYLESQGHTCRIYFYDGLEQSSLAAITENMKNHVTVKAELFYNEKTMQPADAIFATGWSTAYPVYNYQGKGKKFYLLQDYEPMFESAGTYSNLAANTYKMGLHGISASPYTADKVRRDFGMTCDEIELGINPAEYPLTNRGPRKKIFFYARPVTPRRGFELGVLALKIFHEQHPGYEINFIGWDISRYEVPFPYVNRGIISVKELNELYNDCATGLALSFTSMSLLPIEMLASGCIPVVNAAPYTKMVSYSDYVAYAEPNPVALAEALYASIQKHEEDSGYAQKLSDYAQQFSWERYNAKLQTILTDQLSK